MYDTEAPFTATTLDAGSTGAIIARGDYGAGKSYQSYTASLVCK